MLDFIIRGALKHRFLTLSLAGFCLVYGFVVGRELSVDVFPDLNRPTVHVVTEVRGMAPEEIEVAVRRPLEAAVNGVPGLSKVYSSSATGISVVRVEFQWNTDLKNARLAISERLAVLKTRLPAEAQPVLTPTSSIMGEIQMIGLSEQNQAVDAMQLRSIADWQLRPRLLGIPGVAQATVLGGQQEQIQILVNPDALQKRLITPDQLAAKLRLLSTATGGGFIADSQKEWLIRNIGRIANFEDLGETPIGTHLRGLVLLKDVAVVQRGAAPKRGDASINGKPGVIIMVQKQNTVNTLTGSLALLPMLGRDFLPSFNEGSAMAESSVKAGMSLQASSELAMKVEQAILSIPEVRSTGRRTGRAEEDDHAAGVNQSEWEIALKKSERPREEVLADTGKHVKDTLPTDAYFSLTQPISHRLDHILSGIKAQVAIKVVGPDLRVLRQQAAEIRNTIQDVPGVIDLQIEGQSLFPQYKIYPMRSDLGKFGVSPGDVIENLEMMLQGHTITRISEGDRFLEVTLRLEEKFRRTIADIKKLVIHVQPNGRGVSVAEIADVFETSEPNVIEREG